MSYCIYFLLRESKVVYIGQTMNLNRRLFGHRNKDFNSVRSIECKNRQTALMYEARWILKFKPQYNTNGVLPPGRVLVNFKKRLLNELENEAKAEFMTLAGYLRKLVITHPDRKKK